MTNPVQPRQWQSAPRLGKGTIDQQIGACLRAYRETQGLTQEQLASLTLVTIDDLTNWEAGSARIPTDKLLAFTTVLNLHIADFFAGMFGVPEIDWTKDSPELHSINSSCAGPKS